MNFPMSKIHRHNKTHTYTHKYLNNIEDLEVITKNGLNGTDCQCAKL